MSLSSKVNYALDVSGITVGNINITGSIFQNNNPYVASQWTTTSGNLLTYTSGNVNISNGGLIAGTLNVSTITSGNILVRGSSIRFNTAGNTEVSVDISSNQALRFGATEQYQTQMLVVGDNYSGSGGRLTARYSRYSSWEYVNGVSGLPDIKMIVISSGNVGIGTTIPSTTLDVTGTGRITTSLTTGALFSTNQTTTNIVATSSTITNLNIPGTLTVVNVTSTNLVDTTISAGSLVGTTASIANIVGVNLTTGTLRSTGVVNLTSTITIPSTVNNYSTTSGAVNISGDIVIPGSNEIMFTNTGENPPTMNGRSSGTRILLWPATGPGQGDYSIGVEPFNVWFQVPNSNAGYKFYQGTSANLVLATGGNVGIGITSPTDKLEVNGNMRITNGNLTLGGLVNPTITILSNSTNATNGGELRMLESGQNYGWLQRHNSSGGSDTLQFIRLNNNTENTLLTLHGINNRVGIATTNPSFTLDVTGTINSSTSITTGALFSTNQTTTNIVSTNQTTTNIVVTSSTITNLNIPGTLTVVNVTSTNLVDSTISAGSLVGTTSSTANIYASLGTVSNLVGTNLSSSNLIATVATIPNLTSTNISAGTINLSSGITTSALLVTGLISSANLVSITSTLPNIISSNITAATFISQRNTSGLVFMTGASTVSRIFDNGDLTLWSDDRMWFNIAGSSTSGNNKLFIGTNIGIGTSNPNATLDIVGTVQISTSLTTGTLFSTNQTTTNIVGTSATITNLNIPGTLTVVNVTSTNLVDTNITVVSVLVTSGGLSATFNSNTLGNIFTTGGNVGIGTTSPSEKLHVASGSILIENTAVSGENPHTYINFAESSYGDRFGIGCDFSGAGNANNFYITSNSNGNIPLLSDAKITVRPDGSVGIGTTSPRADFDVNGYMAVHNGLRLIRSSNINYIQSGTNVGSTSEADLRFTNINAGTTYMTIRTSGNIGIGITTPACQLQLNNGGGVSNYASLMFGNNDNTGWHIGKETSGLLGFYTGSFGSGTNRFCCTSIGNFGIGTTTPSYTLDISGSARISTNLIAAGSGSVFLQKTSGYQVTLPTSPLLMIGQRDLDKNFGVVTSYAFRYGSTSSTPGVLSLASYAATQYDDIGGTTGTFTDIMTLNTGNVGIGTTSPSTKLDVSGDARVSTSLTTGALYSTNQTTTNIVATSSTITNLNIPGTLTVVNITSTNLLDTNITTVSLLVTSGGLRATFNSNTLGSIVTTGGNVGIGRNNPAVPLHVQGNNEIIRINPINTNEASIGFYPNTSGSTYFRVGNGMTNFLSQENLVFYNSTTNSVQLALMKNGSTLITGNLGIGLGTTTNATSRLHVSGDILITSGGLVGTFNSNTLGSLFTTGGNVGINTSAPGTFRLNVNGTAIITTSLTTGAILSTNQTTTNIVSTNQTATNIVSTNQTATNIVSTNQTATNIVATNITSGTIRATTLISTSNLSSNNFSAGTVLITNTTNANGIGTGGALTVAGGTSVARDLYVGGSIIGNYNIVSVQTTSFSVTATDKNKLFVITGAATVSLLSATSAGSGFTVSFKKTVGITGQVQILPSTGNIDGFSNYVLSTENEIVTLVSDGSTWDITYSRNQVFASIYSLPGTYTFTVPNPITTVYACVFGAGGGGGNGAVSGSGNGGGGGGYVEGTISVSPGDSLTITVGEGGAADTAGGNSSLGDLLATGGGAGGKNVSGSWGGNGSAGSGSGGTINRTGGTGGQSPSQTSGGGGGGGGAGFSASGNAASGYQGGNGSGIYGGIGATAVVSSGTSVRIFNFYREGGGGASGNLTGATTAGANGGFPGGGGSGGAGGNSAGSGADGGVVIFY